MAVTEQLILDLTQALAQIDDLARELDGLLQPIVVPVEIETTQALDQLQREIQAADTEDIDIDVNVDELSQAERDIADLVDELEEATDEADDFARELDQAGDEAQRLGRTGTTAFGRLSSSLGGLAIAAAGFVGLREITEFFGDSIQAASDLEESTSKAQVVFGDFFGDIQDFASTAPQALGLANQAALEFTGTFGNLFTALGLSQEAAADLAPDIVQLGADLASFNNLEVTDALDKLRAGLVGEAEPLRALGVNLNAAAVEAKALELGLGDSTGAVDDAAKVQARYALILEQTTTAQGDFARTSEGLANQQRILNAEIEAFRAEVGQALVPAALAGIDAFRGLLPVLSDLALQFAVLTGAVSAAEAELSRIAQQTGQTEGSAEQLAVTLIAAGDEFEKLEDRFGRGEAGDFADEVGDIVDAFSGTSSEIADVLDSLDTLALTYGLTSTEVDTFREALERALDTTRTSEDAATEVTRFANQVESDLLRITNAAEDGIPAIQNFSGAFDTLTTGELEQLVADAQAGFTGLVETVSLAQEALRDEENEIVEDFSEFITNLEDEIAAQQAFETDIDLLRSFGLDELADVFEEAGVEAAAALADAVSDPSEAARANAILVARAQELGRDFAIEFGREASAFVAGFDPIDFPADIDFDQTQADLQAEADAFGPVTIPANLSLTAQQLNIPDQFFNVNVGAGAPGGGQVVVNQTFASPPPSSAEMTRSGQEAAAALRNIGGVQ